MDAAPAVAGGGEGKVAEAGLAREELLHPALALVLTLPVLPCPLRVALHMEGLQLDEGVVEQPGHLKMEMEELRRSSWL